MGLTHSRSKGIHYEHFKGTEPPPEYTIENVQTKCKRIEMIINSLVTIVESDELAPTRLDAIRKLTFFVAGIHGEHIPQETNEYYQMGWALRNEQ